MNFLVIISVVVFACATCNGQDEPDFMSLIAETCKKQEGASDEDVNTLSKKDLPDTPTGKCLIACLSEQFSFFDEEGRLSSDMFLNLVSTLIAEDDDDAENKMTLLS